MKSKLLAMSVLLLSAASSAFSQDIPEQELQVQWRHGPWPQQLEDHNPYWELAWTIGDASKPTSRWNTIDVQKPSSARDGVAYFSRTMVFQAPWDSMFHVKVRAYSRTDKEWSNYTATASMLLDRPKDEDKPGEPDAPPVPESMQIEIEKVTQ